MHDPILELSGTGRDGRERRFQLGPPVEAGRPVRLAPPEASNAFALPPLRAEAHEVPGWFVGDVRRGGSCNVEVLHCAAHGLTHLETAAHLLAPDGAPPTVADLPAERLAGLMLLVDLPSLDPERDSGRLLAHRAYFGLPETGCRGADPEARAVVELAWFGGLPAGYYHAVICPPRFALPAVPTGLLLYPLTPSSSCSCS
jgi:hypothetical protein